MRISAIYHHNTSFVLLGLSQGQGGYHRDQFSDARSCDRGVHTSIQNGESQVRLDPNLRSVPVWTVSSDTTPLTPSLKINQEKTNTLMGLTSIRKESQSQPQSGCHFLLIQGERLPVLQRSWSNSIQGRLACRYNIWRGPQSPSADLWLLPGLLLFTVPATALLRHL